MSAGFIISEKKLFLPKVYLCEELSEKLGKFVYFSEFEVSGDFEFIPIEEIVKKGVEKLVEEKAKKV